MPISHGEDPALLFCACQWHRKKVRAFAAAGQSQCLSLRPCFEVRGRKEAELIVVQKQRHHPVAGRRVPNDFWVTVFPGDMGQDWVLGVFCPGPALVRVVRQALGKVAALRRRRSASCRRVDRDQCRVAGPAQPGRILPINNRRAGPNRAKRIRLKRVGKLMPMHQVRADSVAPDFMGVAAGKIGVKLIKQMKLAAVVDQAVGVVQPALLGGKVELRAKSFLVHGFSVLGRASKLEKQPNAGGKKNLNHGKPARRERRF